ncbi:hypothetical protein EJC50_25615 [Paenibacillus albus]|uniref:Uncharacterized protein n=1 Tax=Paenibacillus albus TaxID=2495582 RepID=A0A3Q8X8C9_9BACL|nr:hypothetical protein EJC50_25615 [Paenibacillus albus]
MKEKNNLTNDSDVPVFNNDTEHYQNIMGVPNKKADLKTMPRPIRYFGYFFYTAIVVFAIVFLLSYSKPLDAPMEQLPLLQFLLS